MNDQRIVNALRSKKMTAEFFIHPAFTRQARDFNKNEIFTIKKMPYDYSRAFREGNLLITDYSSVAFDFAYLMKPVIYTQFDKASLYENHIYNEGYFSYENDGFGPVTYDYESTVEAIVNTLATNCKQQAIYHERVENFFKWFDKNNSKRVYDAIRALDSQV